MKHLKSLKNWRRILEIPWETMEEKLTLEEDFEHSWQSR